MAIPKSFSLEVQYAKRGYQFQCFPWRDRVEVLMDPLDAQTRLVGLIKTINRSRVRSRGSKTLLNQEGYGWKRGEREEGGVLSRLCLVIIN